MISKPNKIFKIFGSLASRGAYTMTGFGSLNPVSDWNEIATQCYEEGFESIDSNFHLKDLQLILNYMSHGIAYLYQQGIPEWNKYQSYPLGAVTQYKGKLYLNIGEVTGQSLPKSNCCDCECEEDSTVETPDVDKQHWEEIVTMKELDKLKETLNKLPSKFAEKQSDGTIKFTNPDGTTLITEYPIIRIGSNGNWFINDVDTSRKAIGEKGERGERGEKGDRGDKGERGQDGTNGRDGVNGKDGKDGETPDLKPLTDRIEVLEAFMNEPCALKVKSVTTDYKPTTNDNMIIVSGGKTVTFDNTILKDTEIGKQWTIVNSDDKQTTLASTSKIIAPYKGSLKVKGTNAVVTVVKTSSTDYRVFGQTESA